MKIRQTCIACPTEWMGHLDDGRFVYFRYRFGRVRVDEAASEQAWEIAYGQYAPALYEERVGSELEGEMSDEDVFTLLRKLFDEPIEAEPLVLSFDV